MASLPVEYKPAASRAKVVMFVLVAIVAMDLVAVWSDLAEVNLLHRAGTPSGISFEEAQDNDARQGVVGIVQLFLYLVAAGFFIAWLNRMYKNAIAFADPAPRWGAGWTIGAWFVPILNLWRPKQLVNDVWESNSRTGGGQAWVPTLLAVWWGGWIVSTAIDQVSWTLYREADTLGESISASKVLIAADAADAVVAVLAFFVVRILTAGQEERAEQVRLAPEPDPDAAPSRPSWARPAEAE